MTKRKIYILTTILFIIIIGAILVILFVFNDTAALLDNDLDDSALIDNSLIHSTKEKTKNTTNSIETIKKVTDGLVQLTTEPSAFITAGVRSTDIFYYQPTSGHIRQIDFLEPNSEKTMAIVQKDAQGISWAPNRKTLIAHYLNDSTYYKLEDGTSTNLGAYIKTPIFGELNDVIAYVYFNKDTAIGSISIADPTGKSFKNILNTQSESWNISWIDNTRLSLRNEPRSTKATESLSTLDTTTGNFTSILKQKTNLEAIWSADTKHIVYSSLNTRTGLIDLRYYNVAQKQEIIFPLTTRASKCAFSADGQTLYCAIPEKPIRLDTINASSNDYFVSFHIKNKEITYDTLSGPTSIDVKTLLFFSLQNTLIFNDSKGSGLYRFKLSN